MTVQRFYSFKFILVNKADTAPPSCCLLHRMPFSNFVRMCCSLVPRPKTMVVGLGAKSRDSIWQCYT